MEFEIVAVNGRNYAKEVYFRDSPSVILNVSTDMASNSFMAIEAWAARRAIPSYSHSDSSRHSLGKKVPRPLGFRVSLDSLLQKRLVEDGVTTSQKKVVSNFLANGL
jgi:hypothetical protein